MGGAGIGMEPISRHSARSLHHTLPSSHSMSLSSLLSALHHTLHHTLPSSHTRTSMCSAVTPSGCAPLTHHHTSPPSHSQLHVLSGHSNWVRTVDYSPSGTKLISGSVSGGKGGSDGATHAWGATMCIHACLALSADSTLLSPHASMYGGSHLFRGSGSSEDKGGGESINTSIGFTRHSSPGRGF